MFYSKKHFVDCICFSERSHKQAHTYTHTQMGKKCTLWTCCRGNGLGNCLATGNGTTTCLLRYPLKVSVCVCLCGHEHLSEGTLVQHTNNHAQRLPHCFFQSCKVTPGLSSPVQMFQNHFEIKFRMMMLQFGNLIQV